MADRSAIEWTDATWNPIRARNLATGKVGWHCEHASEGCRNCYAETFNEKRLGTGLPFKPGHRGDVEIFLDEKTLLAPLRWRRPRRIFVGSMTDLFGAWVTDSMVDRIFAVMALCPQHTFQVLTKRPERMRAYLSASHDVTRRMVRHLVEFGTPKQNAGLPAVWPLPNVWLGTSCENQATADARVPELLATPAAIRFVSAEPLLGPIDFRRWLLGEEDHGVDISREVGARVGACVSWTPPLDQIIVGGESGPNARPMHPAWARSIRNQCAGAGAAFFLKQHGQFLTVEIKPDGQVEPTVPLVFSSRAIFRWQGDTPLRVLPEEDCRTVFAPGFLSFRVGRKAAGRLLDGVEHNAMPLPVARGLHELLGAHWTRPGAGLRHRSRTGTRRHA